MPFISEYLVKIHVYCFVTEAHGCDHLPTWVWTYRQHCQQLSKATLCQPASAPSNHIISLCGKYNSKQLYSCVIIHTVSQKILKKSKWNVTHLSTSPVRCSHCTLGNAKKLIFNSIIHTLDTLRCVVFFHTLEVLKRASCGLSDALKKKPVVMCGNWNVRQAMSQQVFRVTTFCFKTWSVVYTSCTEMQPM